MSSPEAIDLKQEQRGILRSAAYAFVLCAVAIGLAQWLLPRFINLEAQTFEDLLASWAMVSLVVVFWVMLGIRKVAKGRSNSAADIRGSAYGPPSERIAVAAAYLQNTLEQAFVTLVTLLALVLLVGPLALPFLAASALLFSIGRGSFLKAYPRGAAARAFGMAVTALPSLVAFVVSVGATLLRL